MSAGLIELRLARIQYILSLVMPPVSGNHPRNPSPNKQQYGGMQLARGAAEMAMMQKTRARIVPRLGKIFGAMFWLWIRDLLRARLHWLPGS